MASSVEGFIGPRSVPAFSPAVDISTSGLIDLPPGQAYPAGFHFIEQGQAPKTVKLIRSGIVKIVHSNSEGREITVGLRSEGWWMCASMAVARVESLATIVAVTDCSVSSFSIDAFRSAISRNHRLSEHFLTTQCRELLMMQQYIIMQGEDAATRLRNLYAEEKSSAWNTMNPAPVLRQAEVANLLAITPEHLSRIKSKSIHDKRHPAL